MRRGAYPGSFDPCTVAHLAIAAAAREQLDLDRVDLVLSAVALAKEHLDVTPVDERAIALRALARRRPWLGVVVTDRQLVADIAEGYDAVVMGADKWIQLHDLRFYGGSPSARDAALARLPTVAVAPRAGAAIPCDHDVVVLDLPPELREVSSTAVRQGRRDWAADPDPAPRRRA